MPFDGAKLDRRKYLKALGASSASIALAGCSSSDSPPVTETDETTTTESGETDSTEATEQQNCQPADHSFTHALRDADPTQFHFNPFNNKLLFGDTLHYDKLTLYKKASQEFEGTLAEDWSIDDETLTFTLRDDYMWMQRSGDLRSGSWEELEPVTAEDVALQFWMWRFQQNPIDDIIEDWEVKDDRTIEIRRADSDYSNVIFKQRALPNRVFTPRSLWADTVDELRNMDPETEEFSTTLGEKVLNRKIGPDEIIANGSFLFDSVKAKRKVVTKKNPSHPRADNINFEERDWLKVGSGKQGMVNGMTQNNIDYAGDQKLTESVQQSIPDNWQRTEIPALGGGGLYFNLDHEWFGKPEVRRAIRFAVSNEPIANNVNAKPATPITTGIVSPTVRENWIADIMDDFTDYSGNQTEKAAELMREAGAEKNGDGFWADSAGNPIEAPIKTLGGWTAAVTQTRTAASQLQDFGFKAETVGIENSEFFENHWNPSEPSKINEYAVIKYPIFGGFSIWHPYYYSFLFFEGDVAKNQINSTGEYEVPSTIGNPESSTETVDATALSQEMAQTNDEQRQKEITKRLAWTFNQNIVAFPNTEGVNHVWYDLGDWNAPEVSDPKNAPDPYTDYGLNELINRGVLQANCQ
jgi:peptide/nickel transport system substrate-binding protein